MKAVFLDYRDINFRDLSWDAFEDICSFEAYSESTMEEAVERARDAEAVITDSLTLDESFMRRCPRLKFIGAAATGYNNIDIEAAGRLGIAVANVPEYSREAVAQHTIALLLGITNRVSVFEEGRMTEDPMKGIPTLLHGKTLGIVGFGSIGSKVAEIGEALGMKVNIYSRDKEAAIASDVVSLHCPLNEETAGLVDREFISKMKDGAILINTARGGLVDEEALADALKKGKLRGAGLDVTVNEPPEECCPLLECENCRITPHVAFMPAETRKKVLDITAGNLAAFIKGQRQNRIV